jgi:hypothetical protein
MDPFEKISVKTDVGVRNDQGFFSVTRRFRADTVDFVFPIYQLDRIEKFEFGHCTASPLRGTQIFEK